MKRGTSNLCAFAFDVDGVLRLGGKAIPRAAATLDRLQTLGHPYVLLTNAGGVPEAEKAAELTELLGLQRPLCPQSQLVMAHTPMREEGLCASLADELVLVVGRGTEAELVRSYGLRAAVSVDELLDMYPAMDPWRERIPSAAQGPLRGRPVRAVLVLNDPVRWEDAVQAVLDVIQTNGHVESPELRYPRAGTSQIPVYAAQADLMWAAGYALPRLGMGAFLAALRSVVERVTGEPLEVTQYGKPMRANFACAEKLLHRQANGRPLQAIYMVGDNPHADIAGANAAGRPWHSVLVRTGVFKGPENHPEHPADFLFDHVEQAVDTLLARHSHSPFQ